MSSPRIKTELKTVNKPKKKFKVVMADESSKSFRLLSFNPYDAIVNVQMV
jgi:hypothetical protein